MKQKLFKIGITGSDGFIGKRLSEVLENKGYGLVKYDLSNLDIRNKVKISNEIDIIYHLAALNKPYLSKINPAETFEANVLGTLNLLEAVRNSNVKKIIYASSVLVYKDLTKTKETDSVGYNGIYPYGFEKFIGEEYIKMYSQLFGIDYLILRITGVYGPGMYKNPIFDLVQGFLNNNLKLYVNKDSVYNFIYIDDVVDALVAALDWKNDVFNVSSDENLKLLDIYALLRKKLKKDIDIKDTDWLIKIIGNNEKVKKKGWQPRYSLKEGLRETYNYLRQRK